MSLAAVVAAMDHSQAEGTALLVLLAIARSADRKTGDTYLSVTTIAKRARVTRRNAQHALRHLEDLGELHCNLMHGRAGVNLYHINLTSADNSDRVATDAGGVATDAGGASLPTRGGVATDAGGASPATPREVSREGINGRGVFERSAGGALAAEPDTSEVAAPDAGLRPSQEAAAASGAVAPGLHEGAVPPLTPFRALALDAAETTAWSRILRRSQASYHNGMVAEWAESVMDAGAQTWDDAAAGVREFVRLAKQDHPKAKPYMPSEVSGYIHQVRGFLSNRRRAAALPAEGVQVAKTLPRAAPAEPDAAPRRKDPEAERARRRDGALNPLESDMIARGRWLIRPDGELIKPDGSIVGLK